MFKRVQWEMGADWIPQIAFVIFFAIFVGVVIRALRMSRKEVNRIENLPLTEEKNQTGDRL